MCVCDVITHNSLSFFVNPSAFLCDVVAHTHIICIPDCKHNMLMTVCAQVDTLPLDSSYTKKMRRPPDADSGTANSKRFRSLSIMRDSQAWHWHIQGALLWIVECFRSFELNVMIRRWEKEAVQNGHSPNVPYFVLGNFEVKGEKSHVFEKSYVFAVNPLIRDEDPPSLSSSASSRDITEVEEERLLAITRDWTLEALRFRARLEAVRDRARRLQT